MKVECKNETSSFKRNNFIIIVLASYESRLALKPMILIFQPLHLNVINFVKKSSVSVKVLIRIIKKKVGTKRRNIEIHKRKRYELQTKTNWLKFHERIWKKARKHHILFLKPHSKSTFVSQASKCWYFKRWSSAAPKQFWQWAITIRTQRDGVEKWIKWMDS